MQNVVQEEKDRVIWVMTGALLAVFLAALDQTIVATAIPSIVREMDNISHVSWLFTTYFLALTVVAPIYGKLSDIYGRKRLYYIAVSIFLLASACAGFSTNMVSLIIWRAVQGLGGGAIIVNSVAMIGDLFVPKERAKWQGMIGLVFGVASIAGPLLGGFLTEAFSWRAVFYVNLPIGFLALFLVYWRFPLHTKASKVRVVDYQGAFWLTLFLLAFLILVVRMGDARLQLQIPVWLLLAMMVLCGFCFVQTEKQSKEPIVSSEYFRKTVFIVPITVSFFVAMVKFAMIVYIPLFAQQVFLLNAADAGFVLTPLMCTMILSSFWTGRHISQSGKYKSLAVLGMGVIAVGTLSFSFLDAGMPLWLLSCQMAFMGLGFGATLPICNLVVQNASLDERLGESTAILQLFRSIGGTIGVAFLGAILNLHLHKGFLIATHHVFAMAFFLVLISCAAVFFLPEETLRNCRNDEEIMLSE